MKKKVIYDSDVLIDVFLHRQPHAPESIRALQAAVRGEVQGYVSAHAIPTIAYIINREAGPVKAREIIRGLLNYLTVAPVTERTISQALNGKIKDFEDAITHYSGLADHVKAIVTRNTRGYAKSAIPAILPEVFNTLTDITTGRKE